MLMPSPYGTSVGIIVPDFSIQAANAFAVPIPTPHWDSVAEDRVEKREPSP
jgi:hypothetical protein